MAKKPHQRKVLLIGWDAVLNEFLKEHRQVQELKTSAAHEQKQIEALTTGLQKVSAHLELSKAAPQTVLTNR